MLKQLMILILFIFASSVSWAQIKCSNKYTELDYDPSYSQKSDECTSLIFGSKDFLKDYEKDENHASKTGQISSSHISPIGSQTTGAPSRVRTRLEANQFTGKTYKQKQIDSLVGDIYTDREGEYNTEAHKKLVLSFFNDQYLGSTFTEHLTKRLFETLYGLNGDAKEAEEAFRKSRPLDHQSIRKIKSSSDAEVCRLIQKKYEVLYGEKVTCENLRDEIQEYIGIAKGASNGQFWAGYCPDWAAWNSMSHITDALEGLYEADEGKIRLCNKPMSIGDLAESLTLLFDGVQSESKGGLSFHSYDEKIKYPDYPKKNMKANFLRSVPKEQQEKYFDHFVVESVFDRYGYSPSGLNFCELDKFFHRKLNEKDSGSLPVLNISGSEIWNAPIVRVNKAYEDADVIGGGDQILWDGDEGVQMLRSHLEHSKISGNSLNDYLRVYAFLKFQKDNPSSRLSGDTKYALNKELKKMKRKLRKFHSSICRYSNTMKNEEQKSRVQRACLNLNVNKASPPILKKVHYRENIGGQIRMTSIIKKGQCPELMVPTMQKCWDAGEIFSDASCAQTYKKCQARVERSGVRGDDYSGYAQKVELSNAAFDRSFDDLVDALIYKEGASVKTENKVHLLDPGISGHLENLKFKNVSLPTVYLAQGDFSDDDAKYKQALYQGEILIDERKGQVDTCTYRNIIDKGVKVKNKEGKEESITVSNFPSQYRSFKIPECPEDTLAVKLLDEVSKCPMAKDISIKLNQFALDLADGYDDEELASIKDQFERLKSALPKNASNMNFNEFVSYVESSHYMMEGG